MIKRIVSPPFSFTRLVRPASYDSISEYINPRPRGAKVPRIFKNLKNRRPYKREQDKRVKEKRDWALSPLLQSGSWLASLRAARLSQILRFAHALSLFEPCSWLEPSALAARELRPHALRSCYSFEPPALACRSRFVVASLRLE